MAEAESYELPQDLKEKVEKDGLSPGVLDWLKAEMEQWRKTKLNIAVIGQSRQGKSSLINTMRGLQWNAPEGATVSGLGETTFKLISYVHPRNPNVLLWDCPGIDGSDFKRDDYFDKIHAKDNDYDFYLIVTADIFSDSALYLAKQVKEVYQKRFYLVRTKIDTSVGEIIEDECPDMSEEDCVKKIRDRIRSKMLVSHFSSDKYKIYMVSNKRPNKYDYEELQHDICVESTSRLFREAYLFTVTTKGLKINQVKYDMLLWRSYKVSLISAAGAAVPIPGFSAGIDLNLYVKEAMTYLITFGLDKNDVAEREKLLQLPVGDLEQKLDGFIQGKGKILHLVRNISELDYKVLFNREKFSEVVKNFLSSAQPQLISLMARLAASEGAESVVAWSFPILGHVIAGALSYGVTLYQLRQLLNASKEAADYMCQVDIK